MFTFVLNLFRCRYLIWMLTEREIAARYAGSGIGVMWAVLQPLATIAIFWAVFTLGFRVQGPDGSSFLTHFVSGYAPWLLFSETITQSTSGLRGNLKLIKRTVFPSEVLPIVYLLANSLAHSVFLAVVALGMWWYGQGFSWRVVPLTIALYVGLAIYTIGLSWLVSACNVFSRDVGHVLGVLLNLWFWITPIVWNVQMIPEPYRDLVLLNPMFFVVEGYRAAFFDRDLSALVGGGYFVLCMAIVFVCGALVYSRLKWEFADAF